MKNIKLKYGFILFIIIALAQLFVPAQMIFSQESVLTQGKAYKFKTQPVDPSDPFRGKYITLRYDINSAITNDTLWERKQEVYVYLKEDSLGFAMVKEVSRMPLTLNNDYVVAEVISYYANQKKLRFNLPFNRFYMEESKAKPAEDAYREAQRDSLPNNIYGLVYIKDGEAVLEDVLVNEVSIADYVEE